VPVIIGKAMASYLGSQFLAESPVLQSTRAMASKSDDMAYLQGTYTMTDPKTKKPMTDKGKYLTVFTKQPGGSWKAIADAFNSDPPM
jgi:ketosteroid isomerase-like protein